MNREPRIRALIKVVEGDDKREGWMLIQDEVAAWMAEEGLTQKEVGGRVGKDQTWVSKVATWDRDAHHTPFVRGEVQRRYVERKVPTRHADRVEMAQTLLADDAVVRGVLAQSTDASRKLSNAVREKDREMIQRLAEQNERAKRAREEAAPPVSAAVSAMVTRISRWAGALDSTVDLLEEIPAAAAPSVANPVKHLIRAASRWLDVLEPVDSVEPGDVIELAGRRVT